MYDLSVRPRIFIRNETSLHELKNIEVDKDQIICLSYNNGSVVNVSLKRFSRKQLVRIKAELLNRAC